MNKTKNSFAPLNSLYTVFDFSQMTFGVNTNTTYTPVVVVAEPNLYQIIKCCTKLCQISLNDCEGFVILWSCAAWQVIHMAACVCCGCFITELKVFSRYGGFNEKCAYATVACIKVFLFLLYLFCTYPWPHQPAALLFFYVLF